MTVWMEPLSASLRRGMRVRVDGVHEGVVTLVHQRFTWVGRRRVPFVEANVRLDSGATWNVGVARIEIADPARAA